MFLRLANSRTLNRISEFWKTCSSNWYGPAEVCIENWSEYSMYIRNATISSQMQMCRVHESAPEKGFAACTAEPKKLSQNEEHCLQINIPFTLFAIKTTFGCVLVLTNSRRNLHTLSKKFIRSCRLKIPSTNKMTQSTCIRSSAFISDVFMSFHDLGATCACV